jgi:hypothetical protein
MARPAETYRGARARKARDLGLPFQALTVRRRGAVGAVVASRLEVMPEPILRPVQPKGWDWRNGGRAAREAARSPGFARVAAELRSGAKELIDLATGFCP